MNRGSKWLGLEMFKVEYKYKEPIERRGRTVYFDTGGQNGRLAHCKYEKAAVSESPVCIEPYFSLQIHANPS